MGGKGEGSRRCGKLEHFQEMWNPVFRPKCDNAKMLKPFRFSGQCEAAPLAPVAVPGSI